MEYSFTEQLTLGKLGENTIFEYLNNLQDTIKVENLSDDPVYQGYGIDGLLVEDKDNILRATFFDIKTDFQFNRTGKLFIEVSKDSEFNSGILSTKAEVFYYYDPYSGKLFSVPIYALRMWYKRKGISINHRTAKTTNGMVGGKSFEVTGIAIDPFDLESDGVPVKMYKINPLNMFK